MEQKVTQKMAESILSLRMEAIPEAVLRRGRQCLLDFLGVAVGGAGHPMIPMMLGVATAMGTNPQATLIGRTERTDPLWASLINGAMAHVLDFDDTHYPTILHGYTPVLAAILALGETLPDPVTGKQFLTALISGYETEARVALSVHPSHYDRGWHITGTAGVFGAAAACGCLLNLDPGRMVHALGIAASQAAGLREMFGSMNKSLHVGKAAQNGLLAAMLARRGFTSSGRSLEAPRGFCTVLAETHDLEQLTAGWGERWEILSSGFKPYPCGVVTHPGIEGVLSLRAAHDLSPEKVTRISAKCHPLVLELTGKTEPASGLEGKFSIFHCLAAALADGSVGPDSFTDERVRREDVRQIRSRVQVDTDPSLSADQVEISVRLHTGEELTLRIEHAAGSPEHPLSDEQLVSKFRGLVSGRLNEQAAARIQERIARLEGLAEVRFLPRWTRGGGNPTVSDRVD